MTTGLDESNRGGSRALQWRAPSTLVPGDAASPRAAGARHEDWRLDDEPLSHRLQVLDYVGLALKWRWLLAGAVVVGAAAGFVATLLTTPLYQATATIQIDHEMAKISPLQTDDVSDTYDSNQFYNTEYLLLRSKALAQRVVKDLDLGNDPNFLNQTKRGSARPAWPNSQVAREAREREATGLVMGGLVITPIVNARLVRIGYNSPDPAIAAKVANGTATSFIAANLEHRYDSSNYARQFLEDRISQVRAKLEESERQLVAYAAQNHIINLNAEAQGQGAQNGVSGQASLQADELVSVDQALNTATATRIQAEDRWREAQQTSDLMTVPAVQGDIAVQTALAARSEAEAEYRQNGATLRPDHPSMLAIKAKIDQDSREIQTRAQAVVTGLKKQYDLALSQEQSLAAEVGRDSAKVLDVSNRSIRFNILQREVDTNKTLYEGLLQRYKEIGVAGGLGTNNISVVDTAETPGGPFKPDLTRNLAMYSGISIGLAALIILLFEAFDASMKSPGEVEAYLGLPLLGTIPRPPKGSPLIDALIDARSTIAEAYYSVRTALTFSTPDGTPQTLLVTSSRPGEGKSTTALMLARNLARVGHKVLLIDGDMRDPTLHRLIKLDCGVGLSNVLSGGVNPVAAVQVTDQPRLSFVASGPRPPNPAELLAGDKLIGFLQWAAAAQYLVVIDGPPVLGLADAPLLAEAALGTVFVVEAGATKRALASVALQRLRATGGHVLGALLTKFDVSEARYRYGHQYGYDNGGGYNYAYEYGAGAGAPLKILGLTIPAMRLPRRGAS